MSKNNLKKQAGNVIKSWWTLMEAKHLGISEKVEDKINDEVKLRKFRERICES
jgi:hypothetical protein